MRSHACIRVQRRQLTMRSKSLRGGTVGMLSNGKSMVAISSNSSACTYLHPRSLQDYTSHGEDDLLCALGNSVWHDKFYNAMTCLFLWWDLAFPITVPSSFAQRHTTFSCKQSQQGGVQELENALEERSQSNGGS